MARGRKRAAPAPSADDSESDEPAAAPLRWPEKWGMDQGRTGASFVGSRVSQSYRCEWHPGTVTAFVPKAGDGDEAGRKAW